MRYVLLVLAILVLACETSPPALDPSDDSASFDDVCANLRRIGCPEGHGGIGGTPCTVVLERATQLRELPLACWAGAHDRAEVRACGSLRCIR